MPMKNYGIYLAYPPTVDIRDQGLGRHLAMFLKGAEGIEDTQFTIVCPSWSQDMLHSLFESEQVSSEKFKIVAPEGQPYVLKVLDSVRRFRAKPRGLSFFSSIIRLFGQLGIRLWDRWTARLVAINNVHTLLAVLFESIFYSLILVLAFIASSPLIFLLAIYGVGRNLISRLYRSTGLSFGKWRPLLQHIWTVIEAPERHDWILRIYDSMQKEEIGRMARKIDELSGIRAWYCPAAFWPSFNEISAPRLMCVPDVVLADFAAGFSTVGGNRFLTTFEDIGRSIRNGDHFVTYSDAVKWDTLVDRYAVPASKISVIPHAANNLNNRVSVSGSPDDIAASRSFAQGLLRSAFQRSTNAGYTANIKNIDVEFLFYASQLRPNKNVLTLLRAFEYLLRKRYIGYKLILTGRPSDFPEVGRYVIDHRLEHDVIFLPGLSIAELAACYKLAALAVNPTLSEGGCPFTFAEALSVETPVVMSRISVAEEVLTEPKLQEVTFFNPYDWLDCANRIEWALNHREEVLSIQRSFYKNLAKRTWTDVVAEHIKALDKISDKLPERDKHDS